MGGPLLEIKNLSVDFHLRRGVLTAVRDLSLSISEGETFGIVGETGCGKSVTALTILRLVPMPPARIAQGELIFEGEDLLRKTPRDMEKIRGRKISMIFQEPMTSLNPSLTVGAQIGECYQVHMGHSKKVARDFTEHVLQLVRLPSPHTLADRYPHELSGGMRQRVMIAMALACEPKLLIADEPTTALDVTIQAQIIELLKELQEKLKMALIFISHNLGVVARLCDRIGVMYAGSLVEQAEKKVLFTRPQHPYTIALLNAIPRPELRNESLHAIPGTVCDLFQPPPGCKFHPRCAKAQEICRTEVPRLEEKFTGSWASCHFPGA
ncbi:MAG: peptide/nickel transport system ATP-binding protein [Candidatus Binatota bacterium]|nr:peptide/nickel transport system ATP-binding protein [Candidatus Binatota bacterium]